VLLGKFMGRAEVGVYRPGLLGILLSERFLLVRIPFVPLSKGDKRWEAVEIYQASRLYDSAAHGEQCLEEFHHRYNTIRPHWALIPEAGGDPMTLYDVYVEGKTIQLPKWQGWAKAAKATLDEMMTEEAA
jgi:hypothetical protein